MNKKIKSFIAIMMVLKSAVVFSAQENKVFDQARYNAILKLYQEDKLTKETIVSGDSAIVEMHQKELEKRLVRRAALYVFLHSSLMGGFGSLALYGGIASFEGLLGIPGLIKQYEKNTSPAAANIMLAGTALGSLVSAKIAQYLYKTKDISSYFLANLQEEIENDEAILKALKEFEF